MPVMEQSLVEEKKSKEESTSVKKKRKRESEEDKHKPRLDSQEYLELETAGAVSREEDLETGRRLAKNRKAGKGKVEGDNGFDGDLNVAVVAELDQKKEKKKKKKKKKDAMELEEKGDGSFVMSEENGGSVCESEDKTKLDKKERKKKKKKAHKDAMELEEMGGGGFVMGEENGGSVCESENKTKLDTKEMKKKRKKADKGAMELEKRDNVDMGEGDDGLVCESKKRSVTLEEGKQVDMSKGEDKKREGKKKRMESGNVAQGVEQDTLAAGDVKSGNKEREKSKDKKEAGAMGKEKVTQRKNKGKRVSFTDAVEVFDDEESGEGSESKLVHGKRFTKEEDSTLMEALMKYAEVVLLFFYFPFLDQGAYIN
jgi:hypothetical protein